MSNDNKTLADVQPGGRVRLGEQAAPSKDGWNVLARIDTAIGYLTTALDDLDSCPDRRPGIMVTEAMAVLRETLSAQPSPGGQDTVVSDDMVQALKAELARAQLPGKNRTYFLKDSELPSILREVLAARQPVFVQGCDELRARTEGERAAYMEGLEEGKKIAARQPVGEPVGYATFRDGRFGSWLFQTRAMAESHDSTAVAGGPANSEIVPLFRSPAQAVDLAALKALYHAYVRLLESGRDRIIDLGGTCDPVDVMEVNDVDLQAARRVIDSQAVGNG